MTIPSCIGIVVEHHGVCQKVPRDLQRVSRGGLPGCPCSIPPLFPGLTPPWAGRRAGFRLGSTPTMGINGVTKRPQAVWAAQRADGTPPCVFFILPDLVGVTCAGTPRTRPVFISLRTLVLRSPTHAVCWIPRDRGKAPRLYHGAVSAPGRPPPVVRPTGSLPPRRPPGRWRGGGTAPGGVR